MNRIVKCCLAVVLGFAVAWCSKASSGGSGGGGSSSGDGGHKKVQLWKDGPYWAETNIGAENPEDYGYYFWWGDTVGYKWDGDAWIASDGSSRNFSFSVKNTPTIGKNTDKLVSGGWISWYGVLAPMHDPAHVHWGGAWRMPTDREFRDLEKQCDWTWTTMKGVEGYIVRGKGRYASASIFIPAAGRGLGISLDDAGSSGYYWSSVLRFVEYTNAWSLGFYSRYHGTNDYHRDNGHSVRPVQGFTKKRSK